MAKIIKYQISTEVTRDVVVKVPLLDEYGEPVTERIVPPVYEESGEIITEAVYAPVLVDEIRSEVETVLTAASIKCPTQTALDNNLPIVQAEAYHGEYTIEGEFDPEQDTTSTDDVLNALLGVTE